MATLYRPHLHETINGLASHPSVQSALGLLLVADALETSLHSCVATSREYLARLERFCRTGGFLMGAHLGFSASELRGLHEQACASFAI